MDIATKETTSHEITNPGTETGARQNEQLSLARTDGQDEGLMMVVRRGDEEDRGRLVIFHDILNEWVKCGANQNRGESATYQSVNGYNQGAPDLGGENGDTYDADSDKTVTCEYDPL
ncbi:hypothetical protein S245_051651 [Arachis hypogaea]